MKKRFIQRTISFLTLFLLLCSLAHAAEWHRVQHVIDGDTLILASGEKVRLLGIDTPETAKKVQGKRISAGYYAKEARQLLKNIVLSQKVRVAKKGKTHDPYGRTVAELYGEDGRSVNEQLLAEGAAWVYYHKNMPQRLFQRFLRIQKNAISEQAGMWYALSSWDERNRGMAQVLEQNTRSRYVGNARSYRFFAQKCENASRISPKNRVRFTRLIDAFNAGYAPAREGKIIPTEREMRGWIK